MLSINIFYQKLYSTKMQSYLIHILFIMIIFTMCSGSSFEKNLSINNQKLQEGTMHQFNLNNQNENINDTVDEHIMDTKTANTKESYTYESSDSRTFGFRRPLKLAIPAIMYKLGLLTAMIGVLITMVAKSLLIGIIILVIQLSAGFTKLALWKKEKQEGWEDSPVGKPQNIHVHVHGTGGVKQSYAHSPYHGWSKSDSLDMSSKIDDDYYQRLKELKELKELRESLYSQVI